jgi:hypothetical protein
MIKRKGHKLGKLFKEGQTPWNKGVKGAQVAWNKGRKWPTKTIKKLKKAKIGYRKNIDKLPHFSGSKHHNWKGGITPINEKIRHSLEYKLWRKSVFERDNYTCQKYWIRGGELVAHHINNFAEREDLRLAIDNGITLSKKAHKEFHSIYGRKHNTKEQLLEFLSADELFFCPSPDYIEHT